MAAARSKVTGKTPTAEDVQAGLGAPRSGQAREGSYNALVTEQENARGTYTGVLRRGITPGLEIEVLGVPGEWEITGGRWQWLRLQGDAIASATLEEEARTALDAAVNRSQT